MIPALAFNDAKTRIVNRVNLIGDHYASIIPRVNEFYKLSSGTNFEAKLTAISINGITVSSSSDTGKRFERIGAKKYDLVIPIEGYLEVQCDRSSHKLFGGSSAFLLATENHISTSVGSKMGLKLDKQRLEETYASMIAGDMKVLSLEKSRTLPIEFGKISFFTLFRQLLSQIDMVGGNSDLLAKLAFDDRAYRLTAALIHPHLLLSDESGNGKHPQIRTEIKKLCDFIHANLTQSISLTQMEQMSGLSARKLRYAFRKEFGMGAREWLRKQRLHAARSALLDKHEHNTIAFVAYEFCFVSPSDFSRHYQQEFGELPEETLRMRRY